MHKATVRRHPDAPLTSEQLAEQAAGNEQFAREMQARDALMADLAQAARDRVAAAQALPARTAEEDTERAERIALALALHDAAHARRDALIAAVGALRLATETGASTIPALLAEWQEARDVALRAKAGVDVSREWVRYAGEPYVGEMLARHAILRECGGDPSATVSPYPNEGRASSMHVSDVAQKAGDLAALIRALGGAS